MFWPKSKTGRALEWLSRPAVADKEIRNTLYRYVLVLNVIIIRVLSQASQRTLHHSIIMQSMKACNNSPGLYWQLLIIFYYYIGNLSYFLRFP